MIVPTDGLAPLVTRVQYIPRNMHTVLSFIMNSREVFIHIHQDCFAGTGAIVRLPQCQWSNPDGYGKISQCITTTKHSKAKTVCIFLGVYCMYKHSSRWPNPGPYMCEASTWKYNFCHDCPAYWDSILYMSTYSPLLTPAMEHQPSQEWDWSRFRIN